MPNRAFSKFQYGKETTRGTAVAATRILAGAQIKGVPLDRKPQYIQDALGVRALSTRSVVYEKLVEDTLTIPAAYYQLLPWLFGCGLKGGVTASETTPAQGDYAWDFTPSLTGANAPDASTLEMGDDQQAFETEFLMFKRYKISGEAAQDGGESPVQIEVDYFSRQMTPATFTGGLSLPTMETMNAKTGRLYKDTAWAGIGGTEQTNTYRAFEYELITGVHPKFLGSANTYFDTYGESFIDAMLTLTLEGNSFADAIYDDYQARTARAWRMRLQGAQIGTGVNHKLDLDIWGAPESVIPLNSESQGNNLHQVLVHGMYDPTGAKIVDVDVITSVNAY